MGEPIYNQRRIPRAQWRYGLRSTTAAGCGWIAVYNVLTLMGYRVRPEELIRQLRRQVPLVNGNLGTALWSPAVCLRKLGFPVRMSAHPGCFDQRVRDAEVAILFYRWRRGCRIGAHFVAVRSTPQGFVGYNTFADSTGPDLYGPSVAAFLKRRRYFGAVLTTIDGPRRGK